MKIRFFQEKICTKKSEISMKVTFIYPDLIYSHIPKWSGTYYVGVGSLASVLKKAGHEVSLLHITTAIKEREFEHRLETSDPDLIAFSCTTHMYPFVQQYASRTKKCFPQVLTVCGGVHPTLNPQQVISDPNIDIVCMGEGEDVLTELCNCLQRSKDFTKVRNLWIKKEGETYRNPLRPLIENLDSVPFPDREIFDHPNLAQSQDGVGIFMASRGCPYNCSYCCNHALRQIYTNENLNKFVRFRSVDNVLQEIKQVLAVHPYIKIIHFDDDILPLRKEWFEEFAVKYRGDIALPLNCNLRANLVDEQTVQLLKHAGCRQVALGVESGSDYIRNEVLNRNLSKSQLIRSFSLCRSAGMKVYSFNMVGLPFEKPQHILETIKLNGQLKPDQIQVSIFYPYPHTSLYNICKEKGFLTEKTLPSYFQDDTILEQPTLSKEEMVFFKNYFSLLVRLYKFVQRFCSPLSIRSLDWLLLSGRGFFLVMNKIFRALRYLKHKPETYSSVVNNWSKRINPLRAHRRRSRTDQKYTNTAYPESEAIVYDQKRFSDSKGQLFNKLEMRQLERLLRILPPQQQILEVGCGTGRFMVKCLKAGHNVHGLDCSAWMLRECARKTSDFKQVSLYLAEGAELPFNDNRFNFIYSIRTLNQVASKSYALDMIREMVRVCCNEGTILIEFVNSRSLAIRRYRSVRLSINDIKSIIMEYENVEIKNISGILFFPQTLMNLTPTLLLDVFEKLNVFFSKMFPKFSTRCYVTLAKRSL